MKVFFTIILFSVFSVSLFAETVADSVFSSKDNTLYEDAEGDVSNGAGIHFFSGRTNTGALRRGIFQFDLTSLPENIEIQSAVLRLDVTKVKITTIKEFHIHAITTHWGEGLSDAGTSRDGDGTSAVANDATWIYTFFATEGEPAWDNPGGDFVAIPTDTISVANTGIYEFSLNDNSIDLLQMWYENPDTNFGFILIGDEETNATATRFGTKEQSTLLNRPQLKVEYDVVTSVGNYTPVPEGYELDQNYPNPFNPNTKIDYRITNSGDLRLDVFNAIGQRIRTLENGYRSAGDYSVVWDGTNDLGQNVPSGNYFYRLSTGGKQQVRKMILLK